MSSETRAQLRLAEHPELDLRYRRTITFLKDRLPPPARLLDLGVRNPNGPWDRHFHEFEDWQFDWLLEKAGWQITHREKWNGPVKKLGLRPMLRAITPRYYAVDAQRTSS